MTCGVRVSQLFKGMLYHCVGGDVSDVVNKTDCLNKGPPFRWVNCKYNFDDLGQVGRTFRASFLLNAFYTSRIMLGRLYGWLVPPITALLA